MKTIWKFETETDRYFEIEMPIEAEILCVQNHKEKTCIWAWVESNNKKEIRAFRGIATGLNCDEYKENHIYIGTCQFSYGGLVYHYFEIK